MPTLKYRPILADIHSLPDGTEDFFAHNMEIAEDEDGNEKINYIEKQVGCFTADDPYLEYDEEMDKTYVIAYAVIPEEYTEAANIIRRKMEQRCHVNYVLTLCNIMQKKIFRAYRFYIFWLYPIRMRRKWQ